MKNSQEKKSLEILNNSDQKKIGIFKRLINSAKKSLRGEEKFWKVFWLWGVLLYVGSIIVGNLVFSIIFVEMISPKNIFIFSNYILSLLAIIMCLCGVIMILVYPILLIISLNKCANKIYAYQSIFSFFFKKIFPLIFLFIHIFYSIYVFYGSAAFISYSFQLIKKF